MKRKSVLLSVCLLTTLAITKIAYDAKVRPRAESTESPPAITTRLKPSPRAEVSPPPKPIPGITLYDRIEDAPSWTIRYGEEFWRKPVATPVTPQPNAAATSPEPGNFNLGDI